MPKVPRFKAPATHQRLGNVTAAATAMGMSRDTFVNLSNAGIVTQTEGAWDTRVMSEQMRAYAADLKGGAAGDAKDKDPQLSRLRAAKADLAEIELAKMRGSTIEREAVHLAFAQVVEIVKGDLLAVANWGATELVNLGSEAVADRLDRKMRTIADGFERKCGEVRLIAPPKTRAQKTGEKRKVGKKK